MLKETVSTLEATVCYFVTYGFFNEEAFSFSTKLQVETRTVEGTITPDSHQNCSEILGGQEDKVVVVSSMVPKPFLSVSTVKCMNSGCCCLGWRSVLFVTECF